MTLHRFFLPSDSFQGERVVFPPDRARQIGGVLRLRPGARVVALDGSGLELVVRLDEVSRTAAGTVEERRQNDAEPALWLTLYQGLLKGAKLELILQKCTEIGTSAFVPVMTLRSVPAEPGASRRRRFETIVREAAEQSRRGRVPAVREPVALDEAVRQAAAEGPAVLLWEGERNRHLREVAFPPQAGRAGLFVGPEGGFSEDEVAEARRAGAQTVTVGRRVLRAETAAIVGAAMALERAGDLG